MRSFPTVTAALAGLALAASAHAQCGLYTTGTSPNAPEAGTTDIGNNCDDCSTLVALPFPVQVYGITYTQAYVASNGVIHFGTYTGAPFTNSCTLPVATYAGGPTIFPHWDDLMTTLGGIFTSVSGAPGSQRFNLTWSFGYYPSTTVVGDFTVSFYEGQSFFDVFYTNVPNSGGSATCATQANGAAGSSVTTFSCNTASTPSGTFVRYSFSPTGTGTPTVNNASTDTTCADIGGTVAIFATVTASVCPPTAIQSVTANASALNAGTINLTDQGGGTWSGSVVVGAGASGGPITVTATAVNSTSHSLNTAAVNINGGDDAGDLPASARVMSGDGSALTSISGFLGTGCAAGNDADLFQINLCQPANFSATMCALATFDTQLFMFNESGVGIVSRDDSCGLQSTLSNIFTSGLQPGIVYLGVSGYNLDPIDEGGQLLWINTPFNTERAPDGPGAGNALAAWSGVGGGGAYTINLTGVCSIAGGTPCDPDYNQDGNIDQDDVAYLVNVIAGGPNPSGRDPDFNGDGNIDQDDYRALVDVVAGGPCP
jgi:hypothetical protein